MRHQIIVSHEALQDLRKLSAGIRSSVKRAIETHLRYEPTRVSKSRIKRLKGIRRPGYRLRVDQVRVLFDVNGNVVEILAVIPKSGQIEWLETKGESSEANHNDRLER